MCRRSSLLNGVTPGVPPMKLSPHPRAKLLNGDEPPVVRRPRPSGAGSSISPSTAVAHPYPSFHRQSMTYAVRHLAAQPDENPVLAPPTTTTIRRGDVFQLGRHRLACGDATSATDVARLLAGANPCLMVTDPPYGVNYQPAVSASGLSPAAHRRGAGHQ